MTKKFRHLQKTQKTWKVSNMIFNHYSWKYKLTQLPIIATWIMCNDSNNMATTTATIGYDCRSRPYMTVFLIISILVFIILRKSSFIKVYYNLKK